MRTMQSWMTVLLLLPAPACSLFRTLEPFGVERTPEFSPTDLVRDGAVIAAVVSSEPERLARESSASDLASALKERLEEAQPGMRVMTPDCVETALGAERYRAFTTFLEKTGEFQTEYLPEILRSLDDGVRYFLTARVESDVKRTHSTWSSASRSAAGWDTLKGETFAAAGRTTTMFFAIHDLRTNSIAWSGHIKAWSSFGENSIEDLVQLIYGALLDQLFDSRDRKGQS